MAKPSEIVDAMITRLKESLDYLKTVGGLSDYLVHQADDITVLTPSAYVVYSTGTNKRIGMSDSVRDRTLRFTVAVMTRNYVSQSKLLFGDSNRVPKYKGILDFLEDVRDCLKDQTLDLDIHPLDPGEEHGETGDMHVAIYTIDFHTRTRS